MSSVGVGVLIVAGGLSIGLLFIVPRLLFRPLLRDRLWRLRDEVSYARRAGLLPHDHSAPLALANRAEATISLSDELSIVKLLFTIPALRTAPPEVMEAIMRELNPDLSDFTADQVSLYRTYDRRLRILTAAAPFVTWSGVVIGLVGVIFLAIAALVASVFGHRQRVRAEVREQEQRLEEIALERAWRRQGEPLIPVC